MAAREAVYCTYMTIDTVLVLFLGKTPWPKATWPGKGSFEFIAYSPPSREITENTLQDPRGRNGSRGHGQMLLTGLLPVAFSGFFLIALWIIGGSSLSTSGPLKKSHLSRKSPQPPDFSTGISHLWFLYSNSSLCQVDKQRSGTGTKSFSWRYLLCGAFNQRVTQSQAVSSLPMWIFLNVLTCTHSHSHGSSVWLLKRNRRTNLWVYLRPGLHWSLTGERKHNFIPPGLKTHQSIPQQTLILSFFSLAPSLSNSLKEMSTNTENGHTLRSPLNSSHFIHATLVFPIVWINTG